MRLYAAARTGDWAEAKRVQFKLLDLFSLMVNAPNFPEGFRAGYELRGFHPGRARFPLSPGEIEKMADIRARIACVLAECGFPEAAHACSRAMPAPDRAQVEAIVRGILKQLHD
jgi:dihydrodipicolinate synthase/N-acetylneuraminate lyase